MGKGFIVVASTATLILALVIFSGQAPEVAKVAKVEQKTTFSIHGPDAVELGELAEYSASLEGQVCFSDLNQQVTWQVTNAKPVETGRTKVVVLSDQLGTFTVRASFSGLVAEKVVRVDPQPLVEIVGLKTWIHPGQWYNVQVNFRGVTRPNLKLQKVLETGRRVDVSPSIWEKYNIDEIVVHECGNYVLVAEGKTLSTGRVVKAEFPLTVTPYVKRGYNGFDWDKENLVQLTPADHLAIKFFLEGELGVETELLVRGSKTRDVNSVSAEYVFYKDNTRGDVIVYQANVQDQGDTVRNVWQNAVKGIDGRYRYVSWDDFIVAVRVNDSPTSMVSRASDSDSSPVTGGNSPSSQSPSPGIDDPSPSPPI